MRNETSKRPFEVGVFSFVDLSADPRTGRTLSAAERVRNLLEEIDLAEEVGLDAFGIGEHHRPDFVASAPAVILAAAAARTKRLRLPSAVTVLGSDDPVRVFGQFATLDLLSGGRAEIIAGRGSFVESFPLFGIDLRAYEDVFEEKLDLLLTLREQEVVTWSGRHRPPLEGAGIYPRPVQDPLPVWRAVGGTPASAVRAGRRGLPLALAIIGGEPERFGPFVQIYRDAARDAGYDPAALEVGVHSHGLVADSRDAAAEAFFAPWADVMTRIGRERGWSPMTRGGFEAMRAPRGALLVGTPDEVIEKMLFEHEIFGNTRMMLQLGVGAVDHEATLRSIELLGTVVAPAVREEVARRTSA